MDFESDIPLKVLEYLGVTREEVDEAVERDMRDFLEAASMPMYPSSFTVRLMPTIYTGGGIPGGMREDDAIEYVWQLLDVEGCRKEFMLNFPQIKTVFVNTEGVASTIWYPPEVRWTKEALCAGKGGKDLGKAFLR